MSNILKIDEIKNSALRAIAKQADDDNVDETDGGQNGKYDSVWESDRVKELCQEKLDAGNAGFTAKEANKIFGLDLSTTATKPTGGTDGSDDGNSSDGSGDYETPLSGSVVAQALNGYTNSDDEKDITNNIARTNDENVDQLFREFYEYDGFWSRSSLVAKTAIPAAGAAAAYFAAPAAATAGGAGVISTILGGLGTKAGAAWALGASGVTRFISGIFNGKGGLLTAMASESGSGIKNSDAVK